MLTPPTWGCVGKAMARARESNGHQGPNGQPFGMQGPNTPKMHPPMGLQGGGAFFRSVCSIAIKTVLLSECQNAGLASINDSKVANNQTTLAHARHNDTNHNETVMAMHNTHKNSSPQVKCESNDAPLIWNAACQ